MAPVFPWIKELKRFFLALNLLLDGKKVRFPSLLAFRIVQSFLDAKAHAKFRYAMKPKARPTRM
nr:hypothetical protein [uncultured bacterium]